MWLPAMYEPEWDNDPYDDGEAELIPCPECGADIYEEAEQCTVCGWYVIHSASPLAGRPTWFVVIGVLGVLAVILSLLNSI